MWQILEPHPHRKYFLSRKACLGILRRARKRGKVLPAPLHLALEITLYPAGWLEHSYVACCGTSVQPVLERLRQNLKLNMVYLCLDNDEAGEDACESMMEVLADMDVDVERLRPQGKDWNDDLCAKRGGHG